MFYFVRFLYRKYSENYYIYMYIIIFTYITRTSQAVSLDNLRVETWPAGLLWPLQNQTYNDLVKPAYNRIIKDNTEGYVVSNVFS